MSIQVFCKVHKKLIAILQKRIQDVPYQMFCPYCKEVKKLTVYWRNNGKWGKNRKVSHHFAINEKGYVYAEYLKAEGYDLSLPMERLPMEKSIKV